MHIQFSTSIVVLTALFSFAFGSGHDGDFTKKFQDICSENGKGFETHKVTTSDGYVNTMFRIPNPGKPPIYMQHGILDSADCWIMNHANVAPAFYAHDQGYDIWLGNSRGNKYSMEHNSMSSKNEDYWQFDWQDMGDKDIPAAIEFVISNTGYSKVVYVGHSQGTTQMFYALAHNEDYFASKVSIFLAFGPVMALSHGSSALLYFIANNDKLIIDTCELFGIYDMFPANWLDTGAMRLMCGIIPELCNFGAYLICDEDVSLDDQTRLDDYMGHFPSGTSLKCLDHYGQIMSSKSFNYYDYGSDANIRIYGQSSPPKIPLNNVKGKVPIAMFVGTHDGLADPLDNEWARDQMGSAVIFYHEYNLSHLSFMVAKDMSFFTVDAMYLISQHHAASLKQEALEASSTVFLQE